MLIPYHRRTTLAAWGPSRCLTANQICSHSPGGGERRKPQARSSSRLILVIMCCRDMDDDLRNKFAPRRNKRYAHLRGDCWPAIALAHDWSFKFPSCGKRVEFTQTA